MGSVLIAEPATERIHRAMSGDTSGTTWSGVVGDREPTMYWPLMSPAE